MPSQTARMATPAFAMSLVSYSRRFAIVGTIGCCSSRLSLYNVLRHSDLFIMLGKQVSHYRILERLGSGGMGVVYKAQDTKLERLVALKFLPEDLSTDPNALERFRREARASSALNHPNICTIYDVEENQGERPFIVMEFLRGETLRQRLSRGTGTPMKTDELLDLATQVAEALDAAHAAGIVHRDIKPANIFITERGQAKILDFGLAKLTLRKGAAAQAPALSDLPTAKNKDDHLTESGATVGTVAYMSPEQVRGEELDARSDLFSFGAVIYEMATGRMAFGGATTGIVFEAVLNRTPAAPVRLNPDVPPKLEEIIAKLLDKDRTLRYQSAADLEADLRRFKRDSDASRSATGIAPPPMKRRSWARVMIPTAAVVVAAMVAAVLFPTHRAPALSERDVILLADFDNKTGDSVFDDALKQAVEFALEQSPFINLFPPESVRGTLQLMNRPPDERITGAVAREICQRQGLKAMLGGSIASLGSHYLITLKAENCATSQSIAGDQREAGSKEQVLAEVGRATTSLRGKLGESLASIQKFDAPLEAVTTSSLDALRNYTEGLRLAQTGKFNQAIFSLKRATDLDARFAMAYRLLGVEYGSIGNFGLQRQNVTKAFELRDRASEREQLLITGVYYLETLRDLKNAIETLEHGKSVYPQWYAFRAFLGLAYRQVGRLEDNLAEVQEAVRLTPTSALYQGLLFRPYLDLNRFDDARAAVTKGQKLNPSFASDLLPGSTSVDLLYGIAFVEGGAQALRQEMERQEGNPHP